MRRHPFFLAYLALATLCLVWGTTYLGIRMALESFPPLTLLTLRFFLTGGFLLAATRAFGVRLPCPREMLMSGLTGIAILGPGNGCVTFAEQWIPSGLAAVIITFSPFWMVGVEALIPGGERLHFPAIVGMLIGSIGAALLIGPDILEVGVSSAILRGFLILQFGSACWALGSIFHRRQSTHAHPLVTVAIQHLAAGVAFLPPALLLEPSPAGITFRSGAALIYLVLFGSIVGYSSYLYVLKRLPVALVSIYTYINPVVAVWLGWLFYREEFGWRHILAMLVIFAGIASVKAWGPKPRVLVFAENAGSERAAHSCEQRKHHKAHHG